MFLALTRTKLASSNSTINLSALASAPVSTRRRGETNAEEKQKEQILKNPILSSAINHQSKFVLRTTYGFEHIKRNCMIMSFIITCGLK